MWSVYVCLCGAGSVFMYKYRAEREREAGVQCELEHHIRAPDISNHTAKSMSSVYSHHFYSYCTKRKKKKIFGGCHFQSILDYRHPAVSNWLPIFSFTFFALIQKHFPLGSLHNRVYFCYFNLFLILSHF